jgi:hypothetical protein
MLSIPKTIIIGIYLHGELHLKKNGSLRKDIVPNNMNVRIINGVAPGIPNISTLKDYENMAAKVNKKSKLVNNWNELTKHKIDLLSADIKEILKKTNQTQASTIIKKHQSLYSKNRTNTAFRQFANSYNHSFRITSYSSGDTIPDKLYIKFEEGEIINPDNIKENYFNRITLYNLKGEPDIFEMLAEVGMDIDRITLGQILEFVVNLGVENVIIVDLSCSVFIGQAEHLSERNIRHLRRQMILDNN